MITDKNIEEGAFETYRSGKCSSLDIQAFTLGAKWSERTIMEKALSGFEEWFKSYPKAEFPSLCGDAWQAATLSKEKEFTEKMLGALQELEAKLTVAKRNLRYAMWAISTIKKLDISRYQRQIIENALENIQDAFITEINTGMGQEWEASRYRQIHQEVEAMGGWANYRSFMTRERYRQVDEFKELEAENKRLKQLLNNTTFLPYLD